MAQTDFGGGTAHFRLADLPQCLGSCFDARRDFANLAAGGTNERCVYTLPRIPGKGTANALLIVGMRIYRYE